MIILFFLLLGLALGFFIDNIVWTKDAEKKLQELEDLIDQLCRDNYHIEIIRNKDGEIKVIDLERISDFVIELEGKKRLIQYK